MFDFLTFDIFLTNCHLFDILTSFNLNHLGLSQGYFFQLAQERSEGVQQYAGRLENQYKRLKAAFPDRYGDGQLKERFFFWNDSRLKECYLICI